MDIHHIAAALCLLSGLLFQTACQKDIYVGYTSNDPVLIMNACLMSSQHEHQVILSVGTKDGLRLPDKSAVVKCYINDAYVCQTSSVVEKDQYQMTQIHTIIADFKPGDKVRIEAEADGMKAVAEDVFPRACMIAVDSSSVQSSSNGAYRSARTYSFRLRITDAPGAEDYYRAVNPEYHVTIDGKDEPDNYVLDMNYYSDEDVLFSDATSHIPGSVTSASGLEIGVKNIARIFTDRMFENREYSFVFDRQIDQSRLSCGSQFFPIESYIIFRAATISRQSFLFYDYWNQVMCSSPLSEPLPTVSNVGGGTGYVVAMSTEEVRMKLKNLYSHYYGL